MAIDLFTVEVWTKNGSALSCFSSWNYRRDESSSVGLPGSQMDYGWHRLPATSPMVLTDSSRGKRYLIHDRDPLYTRDFLNLLADAGIESVKLPPRSPNLNAYAERFVRTIKESCLDQMIFFGEDSLRGAIHEFVVHYHQERNHQGLENRLIIPMEMTADTALAIERRQRLGELLNYYYRAA